MRASVFCDLKVAEVLSFPKQFIENGFSEINS
jgi:hypothetical protein